MIPVSFEIAVAETQPSAYWEWWPLKPEVHSSTRSSSCGAEAPDVPLQAPLHWFLLRLQLSGDPYISPWSQTPGGLHYRHSCKLRIGLGSVEKARQLHLGSLWSTTRPTSFHADSSVADPGGGGPGGPAPPPFGPQCRLFNIGPQSWTPPFVNVQEWGCFSIFLMADDVTQTMSKGGGCLWMPKSGGVFQIFWGRMTSRGQCPRGGGCLWKILYPRLDPPPLSKILDPTSRAPSTFAPFATTVNLGNPLAS